MAKGISQQGAQTVELISGIKEIGDAKAFEVTLDPANSRLIVGMAGPQIKTLTLATPDGHAGLFNIQPISASRPRANVS